MSRINLRFAKVLRHNDAHSNPARRSFSYHLIIFIFLHIIFLGFNFFCPQSQQIISEAQAAADGSWPMAASNPQRTSWSPEEVGLKPVEWYRVIEPYIAPNIQPVISSTSNYPNGLIFISTSKGLFSFKADTGDLVWQFNTEVPLGNSPTYDNNVVYVPGMDRKLYALNANTGGKLWEFSGASAGYDTNPLVVEDKVILGNHDGYIYAVGAYGTPQSGQQVWRYQTGGPVRFASAYKDGRIYSVSNDGYLYANSAGTGSLIWRSPQLIGHSFNSYWPVIYTDTGTNRDYIIITGSSGYRSFANPGTNSINCGENVWQGCLWVEKWSYPHAAGLTEMGQVVTSEPWANGRTEVDFTNTLARYLSDKPQRRLYFVMDASNGQEVRPYIPADPILSNSGNVYPPTIGSDNLIYLGNHWFDNGQSYIMGWKFGTNRMARHGLQQAGDEPASISAGGNLIYRSICCDRTGDVSSILNGYVQHFWSYDLASKAPSYDALWWFPGDPGSLSRLYGNYGGLAGGGLSVNGLYHSHGDQSPIVPFRGRAYVIRSNALVVFGDAGGARQLSRVPAGNVASNPDYGITVNDLRNKLETEVQKIINAGQLRPGYYNNGQFNEAYFYIRDYFSVPGDMILALSLAYPHLNSTLQAQVQTRLREEFLRFDSIRNWTGASREWIPAPPEVETAMQSSTSWGQNDKYYIYALWKYYQISSAAYRPEIIAKATSLHNNNPMSNLGDGLVQASNNRNAAGDIGWAGLNGQSTTLSSCGWFSRNTPYSGTDLYTRRTMNLSRNFMYLTPEVADCFRQNPGVIPAMAEYVWLGPYWFVNRFTASLGESTNQHLYDAKTMFAAKAYIERLPREQLVKWLDVPAFKVGDLHYIENLVAAIEAPSISQGSDSTPPNVSLTAPSQGATVSGGTVTLSATASDNVSVAGVQFRLDGANLGMEDNSYPYTVSWNTTLTANGSHTLTAIARDTSGNQTTSAQVTVSVNNQSADVTVPSVSVSAPASGSVVSGSVTVSATASDNVGVAGVQFRLDGSNLGSEDTSAPYSISWDTTQTSNGSHALIALARDAAGNQTTSAQITVSVNNAASALQVSNITDNRSVYTNSQIPRYKKFELSFNLNSSADPNFSYDPNPPAGVVPGTGVTVEAKFTPDNWSTVYTVPGFYAQEFTNEVKNGSEWFYPTGYRWKVRFSPNTAGNWQYKITARDASGYVESSNGSFTVISSTSKGFVKVSPDSRYFEMSDGTYFPSLGYNMNWNHISWDNPTIGNQANFQTMSQNGIQLARMWLSEWSIFGAKWSAWRCILPGCSPDWPEVSNASSYGEHDVSLAMYADYNPCMSQGHWLSPAIAVKPNTNYRVRVRVKTNGITGPRLAGQPYGFVAKITEGGNSWLYGSNNNCFDPGVGTAATSYLANSDWTEITGTYTTGQNTNFLSSFYLTLTNVNAGSAFVDRVIMEENLGNGQFGPNVIIKPGMNYHQYMDQNLSARFDKVVELAEQNGVYLRPVVLEVQDDILSKINWNGVVTSVSSANNFYGNGRNMTEVRWLQQQWWRYLQARWGYSTSIQSWELLNEGDPFNANHYILADEFGKYMHQFAPNSHLVSTSFWHSFPRNEFWANSNYPNIDFADIHKYVPQDADPNFYDAAKATNDVSQSYGAKRPGGAGKPVIRGETGFVPTGSQPASTLLFSDTQGVWLHNFVWGGVNSGGLIESYWYENEHIYKDNSDLRPIFRTFKNFIEDIPLNNNRYVEAGAIVSDNRLRAWGQKDLTSRNAHLWIQNSLHTWYNAVNNVQIPSITGTVTIPGFPPNANYTVEWWNPYNGNKSTQITSVQNVASDSSGNITISVSQLSTDIAVKINGNSSQSDVTPPAISAISTANITSSSASISWNTNEPADGQIEYCVASAHCGTHTPLVSTLTLSHNVNLANLATNTVYYYWIKSRDSALNLSTSGVQTFTTLQVYKSSDLNRDTSVNSVDFGILMSSWNSTLRPLADLNQDGIVNSVDFGIMMSEWGS